MNNELKQRIQKSGHNLHLEVIEILKNLEWETEISVYYRDDTTDRAREIDIKAYKSFSFGWSVKNALKIFLFIECKNFTNDIAVRIFPNDLSNALSAIISGQGYPHNISRDLNGLFNDYHHYLIAKNVGKLYDTSESDQNKTIFESILQPVKSLIFFRENNILTLYYPMVVYRGIDGKNDLKNLDNLVTTKNFIFDINYAQKVSQQRFYIDFVHQDELKNFLIFIQENEIKKVRDCLAFYQESKGYFK